MKDNLNVCLMLDVSFDYYFVWLRHVDLKNVLDSINYTYMCMLDLIHIYDCVFEQK